MTTASRRARRLASLATLAALALAAGGTALEGLSVDLAGGRVTIGAVRGGFSLALAQSADVVTLENVTLDLGPASYRAPRMEFSGVSLSRADLAAILDPASAEPWASRLGRLNARAIRVPEIIVEQQVGAQRQTATYRDVVAETVVQGRIGSARAAGASVVVVGGPSSGSGTYGRIAIADFDLAETARLYAERAGADAPMKRIYGGFTAEDIAFSTGKGTEFRIARMGGRDFNARPTREGWAGALAALDMGDVAKASPEQKARSLGTVAEILDAFEVGSLEMTGLEVRDSTGPAPVTVRLGRMGYGGALGGRPAEARLEGMEVTTPKGGARIASVAFTGFSFRSTIEGMKALAAKPGGNPDAGDLRKLVPTIGTVRVSGVDFDLPEERAQGATPQRITFGVKDFEFTAERPLNGVPTNLRIRVDHFSLALPPEPKDQGLKDLLAMGYRNLDLSWLTAATWNEAGAELAVREISFSGKDMGRATLRGVLGSVSKDVFSPDTAVATVALSGATVKSIELTVENAGLFERVVAQEARKQSRSPEEIRREYGAAAALAIPQIIGNSASAKALGQAVARFIAKPGRLAIAARTKDPAGLGFADVAALGEPAAVMDKLEVTATVE